jgi:hypothetical protein
MSQLCKQFGIPNVSHPYGPPRPVTGIALPFYFYFQEIRNYGVWGIFQRQNIQTRIRLNRLNNLEAEVSEAGSHAYTKSMAIS